MHDWLHLFFSFFVKKNLLQPTTQSMVHKIKESAINLHVSRCTALRLADSGTFASSYALHYCALSVAGYEGKMVQRVNFEKQEADSCLLLFSLLAHVKG